MDEAIVFPAIIISLAFVFYTAGVWGERLVRDIRSWHLVSFWLGFIFDAWGTWLMEGLTRAGHEASLFHNITGTAALLLMGLHAIWASWVLFRGTEQTRQGFHRYSLIVWLIWLVPYFGGMIAGISSA